MRNWRDHEELALIEPSDVAAYLAERGWREQRSGMRMATLWAPPANTAVSAGDDPFTEVLLPLDRSAGDYARRIFELVTAVSGLEQRPAQRVVCDVLQASADVIQFRRPSRTIEGTIGLAAGVGLVAHARDLMVSAACTAVVPKRVIPSRRPQIAQEYLRHIELGQTQRGSFVLTVISRLQPLESEVPTLFSDQEVPFARRVTEHLASGLSALSTASMYARNTGNYKVFDEVADEGVTANMCEAVAGLVTGEDAEEVSIEVAWSPRRPVSVKTAAVRFTRMDASVLGEAARRIRASEPFEGRLLTGAVVRLHRESGDPQGRVTISCVFDGAVRQIHVTLSPEDYGTAWKAHGEQKGVMFRADIVKEGRLFRAENVEGFRLLD